MVAYGKSRPELHHRVSLGGSSLATDGQKVVQGFDALCILIRKDKDSSTRHGSSKHASTNEPFDWAPEHALIAKVYGPLVNEGGDKGLAEEQAPCRLDDVQQQ